MSAPMTDAPAPAAVTGSHQVVYAPPPAAPTPPAAWPGPLSRHPVIAALALAASIIAGTTTAIVKLGTESDPALTTSVVALQTRVGTLETTATQGLAKLQSSLDLQLPSMNSRLDKCERTLERIDAYHTTVDTHRRDQQGWQRETNRRLDKLER